MPLVTYSVKQRILKEEFIVSPKNLYATWRNCSVEEPRVLWRYPAQDDVCPPRVWTGSDRKVEVENDVLPTTFDRWLALAEIHNWYVLYHFLPTSQCFFWRINMSHTLNCQGESPLSLIVLSPSHSVLTTHLHPRQWWLSIILRFHLSRIYMFHPMVIQAAIKGEMHTVTVMSVMHSLMHKQRKPESLWWMKSVWTLALIDFDFILQMSIQTDWSWILLILLPASECADNPVGYKFSWSSWCLIELYFLPGSQRLDIPGMSILLTSLKFKYTHFECIGTWKALALIRPVQCLWKGSG